jgi:undecaprenyl-diphosphatase
MSILEAIILGIIQGLTEFLPISSTAHLTIAGKLFGLIDANASEQWTAFIAVTQLGTMFAVILYFYREVINIPKSFFLENIGGKRKAFKEQSLNSRLGWLIIIGTVPIVVIGFAAKKIIEGDATKNPFIIAGSLIIFAIILLVAEKRARFAKGIDKITIGDSIFIGIAQCFALIPGASRSGVTITAGLFAGLHRETAARFAFLLSIPAVFASGIYEFYKSLAYINSSDMLNLSIAIITAFISGYATIAFLLNFLKKRSTMVFVVYRIILGIAIIIAVLSGFCLI